MQSKFLDKNNKYGLRFTTWAITLLEGKLNLSIQAVGAGLMEGALGVTAVMTIVWAGMEGHRKATKPRSPSFKWEDTGEIIDELGGWKAILPSLLEAFVEAFPKTESDAEPDPLDTTTPEPVAVDL